MPTSTAAPRRPLLRFATVLSVLAAANVVMAAALPLSGEEAYYWTWSRRLDASYYDHPPLVAWSIRLATELFGTSVLAIRGAALALGCGTAALAYALAREVFADRCVAMWSGCLAALAIFFAATRTIVIPDAPLFAFWALTAWCVVRALRAGAMRWWLAAGVAQALTFLAKFHAVLLPVSVALFLLLSVRHRGELRRPGPYVAAAVAALGALPVLWWNAQHDWPTFALQLADRHQGAAGSVVYVLEMLLLPLGYVGPVLYPLCAAGAVRALRDGWRSGGDLRLLLALAAVVPFAFFLLLSAFMRVDAQWAAPGFVTGAVLGAAYGVDLALRGRRALARRWLPLAAGTNAAVLLLVIGAVLLLLGAPGIAPAGAQLVAHRQQFDTRRLKKLFGWEQMGARLRTELDALPGGDGFLFFDRNHGTAAAFAFYTPGHPDVYMSGSSPRKGYQFFFWRETDRLVGRSALLVSEWFDQATMERMRQAFERVEELGPLQGGRAEVGGQWFQLFRGINLTRQDLLW